MGVTPVSLDRWAVYALCACGASACVDSRWIAFRLAAPQLTPRRPALARTARTAHAAVRVRPIVWQHIIIGEARVGLRRIRIMLRAHWRLEGTAAGMRHHHLFGSQSSDSPSAALDAHCWISYIVRQALAPFGMASGHPLVWPDYRFVLKQIVEGSALHPQPDSRTQLHSTHTYK
jgi:hypothetical protein